MGELLGNVVTAADNTVNFADYDADGDCYVDTVIVLYQGPGQTDSLDDYDIWPHKGTLEGAKLHGDGSGEVTTEDYCQNDPTKPKVKINDYTIPPERFTLLAQGQMTIGVFAHELAHVLGLPDLYDTDKLNPWRMAIISGTLSPRIRLARHLARWRLLSPARRRPPLRPDRRSR